MCTIAVKYFSEIGWVGVKNRDRNYKPYISIKSSYENNIERMFIFDEYTDYSEGMNEHGISILSTAVSVIRDELEGKRTKKKSVDGVKIRKALLCDNIMDTLNSLIEDKLSGHTIIFNKERCFLMEGGYLKRIGFIKKRYNYTYQELNHQQSIVRTNHGVNFTELGYQESEDENKNLSWLSSQIRKEKTENYLDSIINPFDTIKCISINDDENQQLNPLRLDKDPNKLTTTAQLMLVPFTKTFFYKSFWSSVHEENQNKKISFINIHSKNLEKQI